MAIQDVGVRLVAEGEAQFTAALNRAGNAVESFGKDAAKVGSKGMTGFSKVMDTTRSKVGKSIDGIIAKTKNLDAALSGQQGARAMSLAWGGVIGTASVVTGALATVGATTKKLADEYMNYALQVKDFGRIIGATPEEASKLIQVADDVRLSVGSMQVAMRTAINKGYKPTVEGLGELSDAYLTIQDPIERSKWLLETFGRSGFEMAKLMELGSTKIADMGKQIEGTGLLMTKKGVEAAEAYYGALDRLNDSALAARVTLGGLFAPVITEVANQTSELTEGISPLITMLGALDAAQKRNLITTQQQLWYFGQYMQGLMTAPQIIATLTTRQSMMVTSLRSINDGTISAQRSLQMLSTTVSDSYGPVWELTDAYRTMNEGIKKVATQKIEIGLDFTVPNIADKMKNLIKSIDWRAAGGESLTTFMAGFAEKAAGLSETAQKEVAKQIGAVDIALEVKTGEVTKSEGIQQLMDLADIDYTAAKTQIDAIMKLEPTDIGPYLENIMKLAQPEGSTATAAESTKVLNEKVKGLGMSMTENQGKMTTWNDGLVVMEEYSRNAYAAVRDLVGALKSIPPAISTTVTVTTTGVLGAQRQTSTTGTPKSGRAFGGPVADRTIYLVGERGPELFIPDANGTIIPNNKSMSLLNKVMSIIPMAKGGKITKEKAHMQAVKAGWERRGYRPSEEGGGEGEGEGENPLAQQGQEAVSALQAREEYAWSALKASVAEYNYMVRHGASKSELAKRKADIDRQSREAQALTKLRTEAEKQSQLLNAGTAEGFEQTATWMQNLINQFKEFFSLLTSPVAKNAMNVIDPLTAHSPAPLALGLQQIQRQVGRSSLGDLFGSVAQLAGVNQFGGASYSSIYNINVPIAATVGSQADIKVLAYQVAKEIAANVRY